MNKILLLLTATFLITSCSKSAKKTLGLTQDMPDELQVTKAKPLEVPPHFNHMPPAAKKDKKQKNNQALSEAEQATIDEASKN